MKSILFALFLVVTVASCNNSPEQNSTVGNSEDSNSINKMHDSSSTGAGVDNSGGTPAAVALPDTAKKADSLSNVKKNRALKK